MPVLPDHARCTHVSKLGRRCTEHRFYGTLCYNHCGLTEVDAAAAEIVTNRFRLDTAEGIHELLARTARALSRGRIQPRRATALAYVLQTMLGSLERVRDERARIFAAGSDEALKEKALVESQLDALMRMQDLWRGNEESPPKKKPQRGESDAESAAAGAA